MSLFRVGIIGGSGFIASHILRRLVENNISTVVFGRTNPQQSGVEFRFLDLEHPEKIDSPPIQVENLIFNSAFKGRFSPNSPEYFRQGKISAPVFSDLLPAAGIECSRLISIGSSEEYGPRQHDVEISEEVSLNPISSYGFWKSELYHNARLWAKSNNKALVHLRPFNVIGPGLDSKMFIGSLIEHLLNDREFPMTAGEQWRSFVSVKTLADLILRLIESNDWSFVEPSKALNVSEPHYYSIREVAERIQKIVRRGKLNVGAVAYRKDEVWHQKPNLEKLKKMMGQCYYPDFNDELCEIIENYRSTVNV